MHAIKNNLTKKLGSLLSGSAYLYLISGMVGFIFLVGWISKAVGLGHSSILLTLILTQVFCLALLLGLALLNQTPKEKRRSPVMLLLRSLFARKPLFSNGALCKFNPPARTTYVSPPASTPFTPPRHRI